MDPKAPEDGREELVVEMFEATDEFRLPRCNRASTRLEDADKEAPSTYSTWSPPWSPPSARNLSEEPDKTSTQRALFEAVRCGDLSAVGSLLDAGLNIELETNDGFTPLAIALLENHVPVAELLLQRGASVHHRVRRLPLLVHAAMSPTHGPTLMQLLLSHGAVLTGISGPDNKTVLHWAASVGLASSVDFLVRDGRMDVEARCVGHRTPMILAAQMGHEQVVKVLWAHGADTGAQSDNGGTPLIWAACRGKIGVVRFLLEKGVDVDQRDHNGHTALSLASHFGHAEVVDILLAAGADVNTRSNEPKNCTPLMAAACSDAVVVVKSLINHGADIHATDANGDSVLDIALLQGCQDAVSLLLEAIGGKAYPKESVAVQFAMARKHAMIQSLIATTAIMYSYVQPGESNKHAWIDWVLEQGGDLVKPLAMTKILHAALEEHDVDMVKFLISHGCDVNRKLESGMTPLAFAVAHRVLDLVKSLLDAGADPNQAVPRSGKRGGLRITPLEHAITNMLDDVGLSLVDLLLDSHRCRINKGKDFKSTAFSFVLRKCKTAESKDVAISLARRMIDSIPDLDADRDDNGFTLLHVATHHQALWMIDNLLDRGADIEAIANDGTTPFLLACQKDPGFAIELLRRGANLKKKIPKPNANALHVMAVQGRYSALFHKMGLDINEQTLKGYTPLACALNRGHGPLACALMEWGASVNWKTDGNLTALHLAARNGLHKAMEKILEQDIDVDAVDTSGWTSLHEACATGTPEVVTQLLDAGADIERPLPNGDRPLHVALVNANEDVALLLLERGADVAAIASKNRTPLHLAADYNLTRAAKELLRLTGNAAIQAIDEDTWTPLCRAGHPEVVKMLISAGADVHYADKDGWTALQQAVYNGNTEAAMMLIEAGASLEARTTDDGLSVRERAVDMWSWCGEKRRVIRPGLLKLAAMRREDERKETMEPRADEEPESLEGNFEIINARD